MMSRGREGKTKRKETEDGGEGGYVRAQRLSAV